MTSGNVNHAESWFELNCLEIWVVTDCSVFGLQTPTLPKKQYKEGKFFPQKFNPGKGGPVKLWKQCGMTTHKKVNCPITEQWKEIKTVFMCSHPD